MKTRKASMPKEYSIEKWNILSPRTVYIPNQRLCATYANLAVQLRPIFK